MYFTANGISKYIQAWGINLFERLAVMYLLAFLGHNYVV